MNSDGWRALKAHLELEAERLATMENLLTLEQRALRSLDAAALFSIAQRRAEALEAHAFLARERGALLEACVPSLRPPNLSALKPHLTPPEQSELVALQEALGSLVRRVHGLQGMNEAYAQTGRQTVERALVRLVRRRAGPETVYGANGRVTGRGPGAGVRERG